MVARIPPVEVQRLTLWQHQWSLRNLRLLLQPGDDLFVMPFLPESADMNGLDSRRGHEQGNAAQNAARLAMAERNTLVLPSGLEPHDTMLM